MYNFTSSLHNSSLLLDNISYTFMHLYKSEDCLNYTFTLPFRILLYIHLMVLLLSLYLDFVRFHYNPLSYHLHSHLSYSWNSEQSNRTNGWFCSEGRYPTNRSWGSRRNWHCKEKRTNSNRRTPHCQHQHRRNNGYQQEEDSILSLIDLVNQLMMSNLMHRR